MKKVVEFLQKNPVQYLATVGRDGKAKCRPFMFCFEQDGKLWFCTNNTKDVYKDMLENPEIEVSVSSPEYAWIRLHGKAVFENNMSVKEGCMNNPMMYYDKEGIYFLTAKGKEFYAQLMEQQYVAISATKEKIAISLRGKVQNIGKKNLDIMFEK